MNDCDNASTPLWDMFCQTREIFWNQCRDNSDIFLGDPAFLGKWIRHAQTQEGIARQELFQDFLKVMTFDKTGGPSSFAMRFVLSRALKDHDYNFLSDFEDVYFRKASFFHLHFPFHSPKRQTHNEHNHLWFHREKAGACFDILAEAKPDQVVERMNEWEQKGVWTKGDNRKLMHDLLNFKPSVYIDVFLNSSFEDGIEPYRLIAVNLDDLARVDVLSPLWEASHQNPRLRVKIQEAFLDFFVMVHKRVGGGKMSRYILEEPLEEDQSVHKLCYAWVRKLENSALLSAFQSNLCALETFMLAQTEEEKLNFARFLMKRGDQTLNGMPLYHKWVMDQSLGQGQKEAMGRAKKM